MKQRPDAARVSFLQMRVRFFQSSRLVRAARDRGDVQSVESLARRRSGTNPQVVQRLLS
jgi:hypothetical protein